MPTENRVLDVAGVGQYHPGVPRKETYLCQGPDGRMTPVTAFSYRGALKVFMRNQRNLKKGDFISVKPRGHGDWQSFKVY